MVRIYKINEQEEIYKIFSEGGTLWFIERPDTNEFFYRPPEVLEVHQMSAFPDGMWTDNIDWHTLTEAYLTMADAVNAADSVTEGGCHCCGHGAEIIPTIAAKHEFTKR